MIATLIGNPAYPTYQVFVALILAAIFTAARQKTTQIKKRPIIFWEGVRPKDRLWATDSMSSIRPNEPVISMAMRARIKSGVKGAMMRQETRTAISMTAPPMVGVPCLMR